MKTVKSDRWVYPAVAAWLVAVTACMALLWRYKATPGEPASAPATWPANSSIQRGVGLPTLMMFAHPECPCTKASLEELAAVMSRIHGKVAARVIFIRPRGVDDGWVDTETRRRAAEIQGVSVMIDSEGREADRFGAHISGQVLFYDGAGALRFAGGITGARGHVGDNVGRERLLSLVESGTGEGTTAYVFGCDLDGQARKQP